MHLDDIFPGIFVLAPCFPFVVVGGVIFLVALIRRWMLVVPGEIVVIHDRSGGIVKIYDQPGKYWRDISNAQMAVRGLTMLHLRVGGPVVLESSSFEVSTHENASIAVTVHLTVAVVDPGSYALVVVQKRLERWTAANTVTSKPSLRASSKPR